MNSFTLRSLHYRPTLPIEYDTGWVAVLEENITFRYREFNLYRLSRRGSRDENERRDATFGHEGNSIPVPDHECDLLDAVVTLRTRMPQVSGSNTSRSILTHNFHGISKSLQKIRHNIMIRPVATMS
jgi:hypothetical protein